LGEAGNKAVRKIEINGISTDKSFIVHRATTHKERRRSSSNRHLQQRTAKEEHHEKNTRSVDEKIQTTKMELDFRCR
jgi:hypothetical protein